MLSKLFHSYTKRKILLILIVIFSCINIALLTILSARFWARIPVEIEWLKQGYYNPETFSTPELIEESVLENSTTYQLRYVFLGMFIVLQTSFSICILISVISLYLLFSNKSNAEFLFNSLISLFGFIFAVTFFLIALKPVEAKRTAIFELNGTESYYKDMLASISYTEGWIVLFSSFFSLVISVIAKKSYGYVTNDFILKKAFREDILKS
ncbi:hypothetical protein [Mycoplasmopsis pullorum]|uniref:Uncharacterized protein n=1 Tax=Mycoplasmopsis pullorum TaxID=48003 RepID=A0A1L4FR50_9BACT|nr:hypothetical protein [Mycoplasmopsis pullorum]APJ38090.1 hypothetical protein BLA55_00040 [Mycoplasmopsis pullorum]APJ38749.1 hypothetical protein BLA55_03755 [Mycoplasmopsis pullorum]APJ38798.1 hypothetical protein BLA55_04030 [Mycoplasmopsis pullorum]